MYVNSQLMPIPQLLTISQLLSCRQYHNCWQYYYCISSYLPVSHPTYELFMLCSVMPMQHSNINQEETYSFNGYTYSYTSFPHFREKLTRDSRTSSLHLTSYQYAAHDYFYNYPPNTCLDYSSFRPDSTCRLLLFTPSSHPYLKLDRYSFWLCRQGKWDQVGWGWDQAGGMLGEGLLGLECLRWSWWVSSLMRRLLNQSYFQSSLVLSWESSRERVSWPQSRVLRQLASCNSSSSIFLRWWVFSSLRLSSSQLAFWMAWLWERSASMSLRCRATNQFLRRVQSGWCLLPVDSSSLLLRQACSSEYLALKESSSDSLWFSILLTLVSWSFSSLIFRTSAYLELVLSAASLLLSIQTSLSSSFSLCLKSCSCLWQFCSKAESLLSSWELRYSRACLSWATSCRSIEFSSLTRSEDSLSQREGAGLSLACSQSLSLSSSCLNQAWLCSHFLTSYSQRSLCLSSSTCSALVFSSKRSRAAKACSQSIERLRQSFSHLLANQLNYLTDFLLLLSYYSQASSYCLTRYNYCLSRSSLSQLYLRSAEQNQLECSYLLWIWALVSWRVSSSFSDSRRRMMFLNCSSRWSCCFWGFFFSACSCSKAKLCSEHSLSSCRLAAFSFDISSASFQVYPSAATIRYSYFFLIARQNSRCCSNSSSKVCTSALILAFSLASELVSAFKAAFAGFSVCLESCCLSQTCDFLSSSMCILACYSCYRYRSCVSLCCAMARLSTSFISSLRQLFSSLSLCISASYCSWLALQCSQLALQCCQLALQCSQFALQCCQLALQWS